MNNAEFRSNIAGEMLALRGVKNSQIDSVNHLVWVDEYIKELARNQILENFYDDIDELRKRPWYEEAKLTLETKRKALCHRNRLILEKDKTEWAAKETEINNQELDDADLRLWKANLCHLWMWNKEIILKDIRNSYIRINKCKKEKLWDYWLEDPRMRDPSHFKDPPDPSFCQFKPKLFEWIEFCVDLPKVWSFEWFKSKIFKPRGRSMRFYMTNEDRELEKWFNANLANALRKYLLEFWVEIDKGVDYERDLHDHNTDHDELLEFIFSIPRD